MIKFNTTLGAKHLNMQARFKRDLIGPKLKGMNCKKCPGVTTIISFQEKTYTGFLPNVKGSFIDSVIYPCCKEFKDRIEGALKI